MPTIHLATEDHVTEMVGRRLIREIGPSFETGVAFQKNGFGYLKSNMDKFCELARRSPLLLLTDLDQENCVRKLLSTWIGQRQLSPHFLFRIAVRETESWLLADHVGMRKLLVKGARNLPREPDLLPDPKRKLLQLAGNAPREIKNDLITARGALASQGLGYNQRLGDFATNDWSPSRAASNSPSLNRTLVRLNELAQRLSSG
jgi:hypothetical protein